MKSSVSDPSRLRLRLSAVRRHRRPTLDVKSHWPTGPPDFVGVGVQKAGTSWWYQCLVDHPLVFHPPRVAKERHFFDDPAMEHADRTEVVARYSRQFPRPPGTVTGEWTPRYLYNRWPLRLLADCAPDAKILVLLRDPLDRCYSGLRHQIDRGRRPRSSHVAEAVERSLYGPQLRAMLSAVEEQRVLVQQYERCVRAAADELARAFAFLGLFDTDVPTLSRQVNGSARSGHAPVRAAYGAMLPPDRQLIDRMRADAREVAERFDLDPALWPTTEGPSE